MPRSMQYFYGAIPHMKYLPVCRFMNRKNRLCFRTVNNGSAGCLCQVQVPGDKVSMKMGFKYIFDSGVPFFCKPKVSVDVAQGVDDSRFPFAINVIRCFTETAGIQLLNEHNLPFATNLVIISMLDSSGR